MFRCGAEAKRLQAKTIFDAGIERSVGIEIEGKRKTDRWTICRVYVPKDDLEAQHRMIPEQGLKIKVADDPRPTVFIGKQGFLSAPQIVGRDSVMAVEVVLE